jgi:hypothetical protein
MEPENVYCVYKRPHLVPIVIQRNQIYTFVIYFLN